MSIRLKTVIGGLVMLLTGLPELQAGDGVAGAVPGDRQGKGTHAEFMKLVKCAENGDAIAQYLVGVAYDVPYRDEGWEGVKQDFGEAAAWYRKAAEQGYAPAQNGLAGLYLHGQGVPRDESQAARYYRMAAEQGDSDGQSNLAWRYMYGEGVSADKVQVYKWLSLSARSATSDTSLKMRSWLAMRSFSLPAWTGSTDTDAKEKIESEVAELAGTMTRQQIALAERFIKDFLDRRGQAPVPPGRTGGDMDSVKRTGSGFLISEDGYLLTNFHVVENALNILVLRGRETNVLYPATLVKVDQINDLALLKIAGRFPALPIAPSHASKLGDSVFTVGFPNPRLQGTEPKFTDGKISSLAGIQDNPRDFQISVAVQPGNSGGALVDSLGNAVGVVTARLSEKAALETTGALPQNVNYAVKSSYVLSFLGPVAELSDRLEKPWPGKERKFPDVVNEAEEAAALIFVY